MCPVVNFAGKLSTKNIANFVVKRARKHKKRRVD